jgi:integrase
MAYIEKRGNSYRIKVSCGYDTNGKQVRQSMTWQPPENMTARQIEKELQRQAVIFEENCKLGKIVATVKFQDFAEKWFCEYAELKLKKNTLENYRGLSTRIFREIGHLRMDRVTPRHIQKFILDMTNGEGQLGKHGGGKLSAKAVKHHVALISTIFTHAVKMQVVSTNPCAAVTLPKPDTKEREIYSEKETQLILDLLQQTLDEDKKEFHNVVYCILAFFSGFRRGELLGLEFRDIDFSRNIISVNRTSNYTCKDKIFTDTPKTKTSYRTVKMPQEIMDLLNEYKAHRSDYIDSVGDQWHESDRLFTTWCGKPMYPTTTTKFFKRFCERHGIRYLCLHTARHFAASSLINAGLDVKVVQNFLGHSTAQTTLGIYCHAFNSAQAAAMTAISGTIQLRR